ncbi:formylglycine-generating enzyme family protein [Jeongeupia naejangsanensis]|uniref:SUMF1/EgtB/PvdO family nonheme iron enzyme n=1 Tax=Jeongeupia naejangsanensis TaxID=613195 RepID=A0ABS2BIK3_9NEIS|nr:SUMF1/EgtB/PvdO family nonheme iron enzyme [Jeongeupia naejangsanensis]MBM3114923.1 SUMF1/EgtB/PvdO family nonheme iron enzyme [Jeongeupia naejangsanensis]
MTSLVRRKRYHFHGAKQMLRMQRALITALTAGLSLAGWAAVTPPPKPSTSPEIVGDAVLALPKLTQAPELAAALKGVTEGPLVQRTANLKRKVVNDLVFVEGGTFDMGDWGPYVPKADSRPVHTVQLTGFYISRYKTTYAEFDTYTDATRTVRTATSKYDQALRHPIVPAGALWQRARDYCQWLGKLTGLPFDLPTEAQWEFAARSRGQNFVFPTDNGNIDHGRNVPGSPDQFPLLSPIPDPTGTLGALRPYSIGLFPPNPLGLYDLSHDGEEWTLDWYAADYYARSPKTDPKGPTTGTQKVARGWPNGDSLGGSGITTYRRARDPLVLRKDWDNPKKLVPASVVDSNWRCVANTTKPRPVF